MKRLKTIESKNEVQLQAIKDQGEKQLGEIKNISKSKTLKAISEIRKKNNEANKILLSIKKIDETLDSVEPFCTKTDGTKYDFNCFLLPLKFIGKIYNYEIILDRATNDQTFRCINKQTELKKVKEKICRFKICKKIVRCEKRYYCFSLKKEFLCIKIMYLNQKKNQKKNNQKKKIEPKNLSSILRINRRV